jgi:hypothetical protein
MADYLQTFSSLEQAIAHAMEYSKRENRPELSEKDSADLYVIQSRYNYDVSSSGYTGIYDYNLGCYSNGKKIS